MSSYFIGVDFGTANTKVCVREDVAKMATPVEVSPTATDASRYLLRSYGDDWRDREPPKVVLLGPRVAAELDQRAQKVATSAIVAAARAAISQVERTTGTRAHAFTLNIGYPSTPDAEPGIVATRYKTILRAAVRSLAKEGGPRGFQVEDGESSMNERVAALQHLSVSNFQLSNTPLFIVDAGGYTTHTTIARWRAAGPGFSQSGLSVHGAATVIHGMSFVVDAVRRAMSAVVGVAKNTDAILVVDTVMRSVYDTVQYSRRAAHFSHPSTWRTPAFVADVKKRASAMTLPGSAASRNYIVGSALAELERFFDNAMLGQAWQQSWTRAWQLSRFTRFWTTYPLLMTGGACRVGRHSTVASWDPLAVVLQEHQSKVRVTQYSHVVYPELDSRFWPVQQPPNALKAAMPYLFVACGYTHPLPDWPEDVAPAPVNPPPVRESSLETTPNISG